MKYILPKAVYVITGSDSEIFLQGQLSNDITKITDDAVQFNCYMQHQGKIFAILWLVKYQDVLHVIIEQELAEMIISRLTMFKLMSDVEITKTSLQVLGSIDQEGDFFLQGNQSITLSEADAMEYGTDTSQWEVSAIRNHIPEIYPTTSETFIPQILNLDENELGVNFTKGCYVGQEVVARMHYLGKAKRKMYMFSASFDVMVGDELHVEGSQSLRACGIVVRSMSTEQGAVFLATLEVKHIADSITIGEKEVSLDPAL